MTETFERRRLEVLVDAPLVNAVIAAARDSGIFNYTLLPTLGGSGVGGRWIDDQITGAQAKVIFLAIAAEPRSQAFIDRLSPMLDSHGLVLFSSSVSVVRREKF